MQSKCINICSSMKVSLLYLCIDYHSLSLRDDVYFLFHLQHCLQSAVLQYYYTMALLLIIIIFIIIRMYLLTNVITIPGAFQLPCSEYTNAHA